MNSHLALPLISYAFWFISKLPASRRSFQTNFLSRHFHDHNALEDMECCGPDYKHVCLDFSPYPSYTKMVRKPGLFNLTPPW